MRARVEALDRSPFGLNCHEASDLLKTFAVHTAMGPWLFSRRAGGAADRRAPVIPIS